MPPKPRDRSEALEGLTQREFDRHRPAGALAFLPPHIAYWALVVPMFAAGLGISSSMVGATSAVVEAAPPERAGVASGALNASRQVGGALGIAAQGVLYGGHGTGPAFAAGAVAYGAALACASTVRTRPA